MAKFLQAAFKLRALAHSPRVLRVKWGDGVESAYPSTWLRASVRDPDFFDSQTCEYLPKHFPFIAEGHPIVGAEHTEDQENVNVVWSDHTSSFSIPWLRVQDAQNSRHLAKPVVKEVLWTSKDTLPEYHYSETDEKFESMMKDLRRWGTLLVHGCPTTDEGLLELMQRIGVPLRRKQPSTTGVFQVLHRPKARQVQLAQVTFEAHTDEVEYSPLPRFVCLLSIELDAPVKSTKTFIVDAFKVAEDLRREDQETFDILSSTPFQHGRHRCHVNTEEDCNPSELRFYDWDSLSESPILFTEGDNVKRVITQRERSVGLVPGIYDEGDTLKYYRAYQTFHSRLNDPYYRHEYVLQPGTLLIYDNYRLTHGRTEIHPSTHRLLKGLCIPEDGWRSRWRLLLGHWSGLEAKWCYGCSDEALNILAQRKLL